jgi:hypothetical protein
MYRQSSSKESAHRPIMVVPSLWHTCNKTLEQVVNQGQQVYCRIVIFFSVYVMLSSQKSSYCYTYRYWLAVIAVHPANSLNYSNVPDLLFFGSIVEEIVGMPDALIAMDGPTSAFLPTRITAFYGRQFELRVSVSAISTTKNRHYLSSWCCFRHWRHSSLTWESSITHYYIFSLLSFQIHTLSAQTQIPPSQHTHILTTIL